jgi:hypothetical protein
VNTRERRRVFTGRKSNYANLIAGILTGCVLLLVTGCGIYTFNPGGKSDIEAIAVQRFENSTDEYGLASQVTDLVIDAFLADGTMKVVSEDNADAVLIGKLVGYEHEPLTYDENDQVTRYEVIMSFDIALKKPNSDDDIWSQRIRQQGSYDTDEQTEEDGRQQAIQLLIDAIIDKTIRSW